MKFVAKLKGLESTGEQDHIGNLLIGSKPGAKIAGLVEDAVSSTVASLKGQATGLINNAVNNLVDDALDDVFEGGFISNGLDSIKYDIQDSIRSTITDKVNSVITDDIASITQNIGDVKSLLTGGVDDIKDEISSILQKNIANIPDLDAVVAKLDSVLSNAVTNEINGVVDSLAGNFGKSIQDVIFEGIEGPLGEDLARQLGSSIAGEAMDALRGFKIVLGSSLNRTVVGQGTLLVGAGSKMISLSQGALSIGAGAALMKLSSGMMSIGSGSSKVSIGQGDVRIGGESIAFKSPNITVVLEGAVTGSANTTLENLADGIITVQTSLSGETLNKGTVGAGAVVFDTSSYEAQLITVAGTQSWSFTGWPPGYKKIRIFATNAGLGSLSFPTIRWFKGDGTSSTTFSSMGVTLQSSGINIFDIWSPDGGTTLHGTAM